MSGRLGSLRLRPQGGSGRWSAGGSGGDVLECVGDAGCLCFNYGGEFFGEGQAGREVEAGLERLGIVCCEWE